MFMNSLILIFNGMLTYDKRVIRIDKNKYIMSQVVLLYPQPEVRLKLKTSCTAGRHGIPPHPVASCIR